MTQEQSSMKVTNHFAPKIDPKQVPKQWSE